MGEQIALFTGCPMWGLQPDINIPTSLPLMSERINLRQPVLVVIWG